MTGIALALANLQSCEQEFELRDRICRHWTEAHGRSVWREGHPSDREKLRYRREAKLDLKFARHRLAKALANTHPAGNA